MANHLMAKHYNGLTIKVDILNDWDGNNERSTPPVCDKERKAKKQVSSGLVV